ncbi:MAG: hypothetical protein HYX27_24260 [Acidobacteria bacterium]|nr:hypothetical protein [Acidobacteriota bacterium]
MLGQDHYIYRLRAACIQHPQLNRHQLAALDRELTIVKASSTPEEHLAASGDMIGIARAAALDRAANALDIARRYDDPWSAAAAGIEYVHAQQGEDHAALYTSIVIGHERAGEFRSTSLAIRGSFRSLLTNLLHIHTSNFELETAYAGAAHAFQVLRNSDPAFAPSVWLDQPRYRARVPWNADLVHQWLEPYWDAFPANAPAIPTDPGFLIDHGESEPHDWPLVEPLPNPPATGLADAYIERQQHWPDSVLAAFWTKERNRLQEAGSSVAQYAIAQECEMSFSVEATRHFLEYSAHLAPLRAKANHAWEGTEASRDGLEKALAVSFALTGLTYEEILATPRIRDFIENNLNPRLQQGSEGFGAMDGEAGFDLLRHCYPWQAVRGFVDFYA